VLKIKQMKKAILTKNELKEPIFTTWGRIRTLIGYSSVVNTLKDERLRALIDKFQKDLEREVKIL
jgi:hypothetical protein